MPPKLPGPALRYAYGSARRLPYDAMGHSAARTRRCAREDAPVKRLETLAFQVSRRFSSLLTLQQKDRLFAENVRPAGTRRRTCDAAAPAEHYFLLYLQPHLFG